MDLVSQAIVSLVEEYGPGLVLAARLFGSRAKGTAPEDSDHDVLLLTVPGGTLSSMHRVAGVDFHVSLYPLDRIRREIPPQWWEPLAGSTAVPLGRDDDEGERIAARARDLWADERARKARARKSARAIEADIQLLAQRRFNVRASASLRGLVDAAVGVACFRAGLAEPSKRARISGARAALSLQEPALQKLLAALSLADPPPHAELRNLAVELWDQHLAWIDRRAVQPFHRSLLGGPNRWERDTARAAAAGEHHDVAFYLGAALDRLLNDEAGAPAGEPWFTALWALRYRGDPPTHDAAKARYEAALALLAALRLP